MEYIVEFTDHNGNIRKTKPFNCLESAQLANQFIILLLKSLEEKFESRIIPADECIENLEHP